jgi:hypothetical protein
LIGYLSDRPSLPKPGRQSRYQHQYHAADASQLDRHQDKRELQVRLRQVGVGDSDDTGKEKDPCGIGHAGHQGENHNAFQIR